MTKLECDARCPGSTQRGEVEKAVEQHGVGLEVRRELEEYDAEFIRLTDRFERGDKLGHIGIAFVETLEVGDALRSFETEAKMGGSCGEPAFERFCCGQGAKGVVDLDGGQLRGIKPEEIFCRSARRVELRFPRRVSPAGGSGMDSN